MENKYIPNMATETLIPKAIGMDETTLYDTACFSCHTANGIYHCKHCGVMCENCSKNHQKTPKKKGHWAMRIRLLKKPAPPIPKFDYLNKCELHNENKIKGYCLDCGELYCKECRAEKHEQCTMEGIDSLSKNVVHEKEIREAKMELVDMKNRAKRLVKHKKLEISNLTKHANKFIKEVQDTRKEIERLLDTMVKLIIKEKEEFCKTEHDLIETDIKLFQDIIPVMEKGSEVLDLAFKNGKDTDVWIGRKKVERLVSYYDDIVDKKERDRDDGPTFEFLMSDNLKGLLGQAPITAGKMKVITSRTYGKEKAFIAETEEPKPRKKPFGLNWTEKQRESTKSWMGGIRPIHRDGIPPLPTIVTDGTNRHVKSVSPNRGKTQYDLNTVKTKSVNGSWQVNRKSKKPIVEEIALDRVKLAGMSSQQMVKLARSGQVEINLQTDAEKCCITGCAYLPNGRVLLVDNHNQNIKLYNAEFELLTVKPLSERPWDVTSCFKSVVAISYPFANMIEIVDAGVEMRVAGTIQTERKCHGAGYHRGEEYLYTAIGEGNDAKLQAYSMDGNIRKVIIPKPGVLKEPCYLEMSRDCSIVYISDLDNGVIGFDTKSGDLLTHYKDPKIKRYWDLTCDQDGRVYVITTNPDGLFCIAGKHNGHLLIQLDGANKPCSLCYNPITKTLLTTRWQTEFVEFFKVMSDQ